MKAGNNYNINTITINNTKITSCGSGSSVIYSVSSFSDVFVGGKDEVRRGSI